MELHLQRFESGNDSTLGLLYAQHSGENVFQCFTCEDEKRTIKVKGKTRIPEGRYKIELRTEGGMHQKYAQKFEWHEGMLHLLNVPDFEYVYIHIGNTDKDTEGCILVGNGAKHNVENGGGGTISDSTNAYTNLYIMLLEYFQTGRPVYINVYDRP